MRAGGKSSPSPSHFPIVSLLSLLVIAELAREADLPITFSLTRMTKTLCPVNFSTPTPSHVRHHHRLQRSTTLFPRLDLPGFLSGTDTKREVWLLRTGFGIAPVN